MLDTIDNDPLMEVALECTNPVSSVGGIMEPMYGPIDPTMFFGSDKNSKKELKKMEEKPLDASFELGGWDVVSISLPELRLGWEIPDVLSDCLKLAFQKFANIRFHHSSWFALHLLQLCGRGKQVSDHEGNQRLRSIVSTSIDQYERSNRQEKSALVRSIVQKIQNASPMGGFVRKDSNGQWYDIGTSNAHEKVRTLSLCLYGWATSITLHAYYFLPV